MALDLSRLLRELWLGLSGLCGARLRGLYPYGSYARATAQRESDADVLIVLDRIDRYGSEVDRTGDLDSRLSLEHGVAVSRVFAAEQDRRTGDSPFLNSVRPEAISA